MLMDLIERRNTYFLLLLFVLWESEAISLWNISYIKIKTSLCNFSVLLRNYLILFEFICLITVISDIDDHFFCPNCNYSGQNVVKIVMKTKSHLFIHKDICF